MCFKNPDTNYEGARFIVSRDDGDDIVLQHASNV